MNCERIYNYFKVGDNFFWNFLDDRLELFEVGKVSRNFNLFLY